MFDCDLLALLLVVAKVDTGRGPLAQHLRCVIGESVVDGTITFYLCLGDLLNHYINHTWMYSKSCKG